jgi:type I restriction enzyme, R subunit
MMSKYANEDAYEDTLKDEFVNGDDLDLLMIDDPNDEGQMGLLC